ncbi:MAG: hypothetical protein ACFFCW_47725, partial [Candidatus Hodarchaeota archaeon]
SSVQVVLTPTEAKRLLSKAVLNMDEVKRALEESILIIHPSSTTVFMMQELGFKYAPTSEYGIWICGHISPKGLCVPRVLIDTVLETEGYGPSMYPFDFIVRKGKLVPFGEQSALGPALEEIDSNGAYVKGVNLIDPDGKIGVLLMARSTGGSIGLVIKKQKEKNFKMIIPVGLEKRISVPLEKAMKAAMGAKRARGVPCNIWQLQGEIITEVEAFRQLCDVEATPISAGGVCGAEGAIIWVLEGEEENVERAYELCEEIHGHELPYELDVYECEECPNPFCSLAGRKGKKRVEEDLKTGGLKVVQ